MLVKKWMSSAVTVMEPEDTVGKAEKIFREQNPDAILVQSGDTLSGIVTRRQLEEHPPNPSLPIQDIIHVPGAILESFDPVEKAARLMISLPTEILAVREDNKLCGILTHRDVLRAFTEMSGARWELPRVTLVVNDNPEIMADLLKLLAVKQVQLVSLFLTRFQMPPGKMELILRLDCDHLEEVLTDIQKQFGSVMVHEG